MRTKALFLTAAACVVSAATMAQVVSVNVVGFINKECASGWTLIANQLEGTNNKISTILQVPPDTQVWMWDGQFQTFVQLNWTPASGGWYDPAQDAINNDYLVAPGTGMFIFNPWPTNFTVTLVGQVPQNDVAPGLTQKVTKGFTLLGSIPPVSATLRAAADSPYYFPATVDMILWFWDYVSGGVVVPGWTQFTYTSGGWYRPDIDANEDPVPPVAAGFWVDTLSAAGVPAAGADWNMTFKVN